MNKENALYQQDLRNIVSMPGIETLHGKTILITGATGMVGTHLIDALMLLGDVKVYAVGRDKNRAMDRLGSYYDSPLFTFVEQDVCNKFPSDIKPDIIIPLASNTHPLAYSQYPVETMLINIKGAEHALNLAVETGATVLYPSTVEVYGNAIGEDTFSETESKRSAEAMCQSFIAEKGAKVKIVRLSRLFGPTMLMTDSKASSQFIKKALAHEDIILKSEGNQLFSYTYITDAVRAMLHVLIYGEVGTAYNISCESCDVRLKEFAGLCAQYNGKDVIFELPSETERKGFSVAQKAVLDNSRLCSIGWTPLYNMKEALWRTLDIIAS